MKKSLATLFSVFFFLAATDAFAADVPWKLDGAHSEVGFSVRHLGISNVKGRFTKISAEIVADEKTGKISSVSASANAASVNTGIDARDDHLRGADFFDVAKYPEIKLKSRSFKIKGDKAILVADFTMKGVTKKVTFKGEYLGSQKADLGGGKTLRAGYSLSGKISRKDFGLTWNNLVEGVSAVGDDVKIHFEVEIYRDLK